MKENKLKLAIKMRLEFYSFIFIEEIQRNWHYNYIRFIVSYSYIGILQIF